MHSRKLHFNQCLHRSKNKTYSIMQLEISNNILFPSETPFYRQYMLLLTTKTLKYELISAKKIVWITMMVLHLLEFKDFHARLLTASHGLILPWPSTKYKVYTI